MSHSDPFAYTIIVRMWQERTASGQPAWRGSLRCVQTDGRGVFQSLSQLSTAVASLVGDLPADDATDGTPGGDAAQG